MLTIRVVEDTINLRAVSDVCFEEWRGQSLGDMAPADATACLVNGELVRRSDPGWDRLVPPDGSTLNFIVTDTGIELVVIAALVVGSLLVSINPKLSPLYWIFPDLFAPSGAGASNLGGGDSSPTYGFDAIQNVVTNGATIPVVYGEHLVGGQVIHAFRKGGSGDNQMLYAIIALSEGPVQSIGQYTSDQNGLTGASLPTGMLINGIEASTYKDVVVSLRLGSNSQTPMAGFENIVSEYPQSFKMVMRPSRAELTWRCRDAVNAIEINLVLPNGLWRTNTKGKVKGHSAGVTVRVYEEDGVTQVDARTFTIGRRTQGTAIYWTVRMDRMTEAKRYVVKVYRAWAGGHEQPPGKKTYVDQMEVVSINEIQYARLAYPNVALVGVRIRASSQLSGTFPRIQTMMKGRKVATPSGTAWSSNPAWICKDLLTNTRYGLGNILEDTDIDQDSFEDWADFCDELVETYTGSGQTEKRFQFNGVFDVAKAGWEQVLAVGATARGVPVKVGNTIRAKVERTQAALQLFGMGQIAKGSFQLTWVNPAERYNVVEVQFLNAENNYEQDVVTAFGEGLEEPGAQIRKKSIQLYGITNASQARRQATYFLRSEQYVGKTVTFEVGIEAVACEPGDVIVLSHDVPEWGISGRIEGATDSEITLDRTITFESDVVYEWLERDNETGEMLTSEFTMSAGESETLPFAPLHGADGAVGRPYVLGRKLTYQHLFLITATRTTRKGLGREITAIEYVPEVYTDDAEAIETDPYVPPEGDEADPVTDLALVESSTQEGVSTITASWTAAADALYYVVWYRVNREGSELTEAGTTTGTSLAFDIDALLGQVVEVRVQTVNTDNLRNDVDDAPAEYLTIAREDYGTALVTFPGNVANLALSPVSGTQYTLSWDAVAGADRYEVREGNWHDGPVVYAGTGTSTTVRLDRVAHRFNVRALEGDYWSPGNARVISSSVALSGYSTLAEAETIDLSGEGARTNFSPVDWHDATGRALLQLDEDLPVEYLSKTFDLGSTANTHCSVAARVLPWWDVTANESDAFAAANHLSWHGKINQASLAWTMLLEYSTDASTWQSVLLTDSPASTDRVVSARYFRVRFAGAALNTPPDFAEDEEDDEKLARLLLEQIDVAFYR